MYDTIIIGGGIASLYCAYKLKKADIACKIIVLEKAKSIGGRISTREFRHMTVPMGAGVGRYKKDTIMRHLMKDFDIPVTKFKAHIRNNAAFIKQTLHILKKAYTQKQKHMTFKDFAVSVIGDDTYGDFVKAAGFSDFDNADVKDTLYHYGFDDTYNGHYNFAVPWMRIIDNLANVIGLENIKCGVQVNAISVTANSVTAEVSTKNGDVYHGKKVVCGVDIDSLRKLLGHVMPLYNMIVGQPFMRVYVELQENAAFREYIGNEMVVVNGHLQKIIPMDANRNIYMIAYSDNAHAYALYNVLKRNDAKEKLARMVYEATRIHIQIRHMIYKFWPNGTHYYKPLPKSYKNRHEFLYDAQRPAPNVFVVGEVVSMHQGWSHGALDSVHAIYKDLCCRSVMST